MGKCACSDTACSLNCAKQTGSPLAPPVAACITSNCASVSAKPDVDCTKSACPSQCECSLDKCSDQISKCLADDACAAGQACAMKCACSDTACNLHCAKQMASALAPPVAACINSNCASISAKPDVDCTKSA